MAASMTKCLVSRSRVQLLKPCICIYNEPWNGLATLTNTTNISRVKVLTKCLVSASLHTHRKIAPQVSVSLSKLRRQKIPNVRNCALFARWNSSTPVVSSTALPSQMHSTDYIPPPPSVTTPSPPSTELFDSLNQLGEPTLSSLGLAKLLPTGLPTGWIQTGLEAFHVNLGLSWAGSIVLLTVIIRACLIPLNLSTYKKNIINGNVNPGYQELMDRYKKATENDDVRGAVEMGQQVMAYQRKHGIDPNESALKKIPKSALIQGPIFITFLWSLREMVNVPVTSMKTGGFLWFPDLLAQEPMYGLPLMTCAAMGGVMMISVDSSLRKSPIVLGIMVGAPMIMYYMIYEYASAMLVYWFTTNSITLIQTAAFNIPAVKKYFEIPSLIKQPKTNKGKDFKKGIKSAWNTAFSKNTLRKSKQREETNYRKAATGPIVETFSYNPKKIKRLE